MDTEGGGWTFWSAHGPDYKNNIGETMFNIPDWKLDLGFNEWYVVAPKNVMWYGGANQAHTWRSNGINLWFNNFIIGDKAYHSDTYNAPENNHYGK